MEGGPDGLTIGTALEILGAIGLDTAGNFGAHTEHSKPGTEPVLEKDIDASASVALLASANQSVADDNTCCAHSPA